jgi:hypothetical protein
MPTSNTSPLAWGIHASRKRRVSGFFIAKSITRGRTYLEQKLIRSGLDGFRLMLRLASDYRQPSGFPVPVWSAFDEWIADFDDLESGVLHFGPR